MGVGYMNNISFKNILVIKIIVCLFICLPLGGVNGDGERLPLQVSDEPCAVFSSDFSHIDGVMQ